MGAFVGSELLCYLLLIWIAAFIATYMKIKLLKMCCNLHDAYKYLNDAYLWIFPYFDLLVFKYTLKNKFFIFTFIKCNVYLFFALKVAYNSLMSKYPNFYIYMSVS